MRDMHNPFSFGKILSKREASKVKKLKTGGSEAEMAFSDLCAKRGWVATFTGGKCDFEVNGKRVEIKGSSVHKDGNWGFSFYNNRGHFDYLACCGYLGTKTYWFIIPAKHLTGTSVSFNPQAVPVRWWKWANRWDLIGLT